METRILPTDQDSLVKQAVDEAARLLNAGEIVALPTETVYGLAADALNPAAVAKVFEAKERPTFDPLIVHLPHKKELATVAAVPDDIALLVTKLTDRFWPGALTLVLPKQPCVPDIVTAGLPTVAVRVSSNGVFKKVAAAAGCPIAAPSANRFGAISPTSAAAVMSELEGRIPLILDGGASHFGLESTIIKIEAATPKPIITILRPGPITPDDLKVYGRVKRLERNLTDEASEAPGQPKDGYTDLTDWASMQILSPGKGKLPEAAVRFFYALRFLDESGADEIIAEPLHEHGMGIAMMDRLRRAAVKGAVSSGQS